MMFSGCTPSDSRYALNIGAYRYMLRTRGIPTRWVARDCIRAMRCLTLDFHDDFGSGSATLCGLRERHTSRAAMSTKFGLAAFTASRPALMPRMELTSSTCPFSQVEIMRRRSPAWSGTFDLNTGSGDDLSMSPTLTSMKVRRQLFLQK